MEAAKKANELKGQSAQADQINAQLAQAQDTMSD